MLGADLPAPIEPLMAAAPSPESEASCEVAPEFLAHGNSETILFTVISSINF